MPELSAARSALKKLRIMVTSNDDEVLARVAVIAGEESNAGEIFAAVASAERGGLQLEGFTLRYVFASKTQEFGFDLRDVAGAYNGALHQMVKAVDHVSEKVGKLSESVGKFTFGQMVGAMGHVLGINNLTVDGFGEGTRVDMLGHIDSIVSNGT